MAVLRTESVTVKVNGTNVTGFLVKPDDGAQHPGVVLIQEWWGIESHVIELAHKLAAEGFVTLVPDHYHGRVTTEPDEAGKEMMALFDNIELAIKEVGASIAHLQGLQEVDPKKIGVIGFCMGGRLAFHAAERFASVGAAVPFYATAYDPQPTDVANVQAPVLAIFGAEDPFVSKESIDKVRETFAAAGKGLTISMYQAGHAFLNPLHGAMHPEHAPKAWAEAIAFLRQNLR